MNYHLFHVGRNGGDTSAIVVVCIEKLILLILSEFSTGTKEAVTEDKSYHCGAGKNFLQSHTSDVLYGISLE